jgi:hypothetical protein
MSVPVVALPLPVVALFGVFANRPWAAEFVHATTLVATTSWLWLLYQAYPWPYATPLQTLIGLAPGLFGVIVLVLFSLAAHRWSRHRLSA